ncbi:ankyrin repeat domain-containing protein 6-like [Ornithodoros turicata]|uniref:ankyrin repeat domain-containing protein 6-like n=1 Tax=Ornithodoros turicata TaxID=34597 RepID=UPI0031390654
MTTFLPAHERVLTLAEKLYQAAVAGQTEKVTELCRLGAKIEPDSEGRTALHLAAANGYVDTARALILAGAKVNAVDACGYSPLHQAATEGHEEVARLLAKHNCHVDIQDEMHGNTALHEAAWKGYSRTIEVLCKHKANVYIKNKGGFTPLHLACQNGHNQSTRILLLGGCKPDIKNNYGDTPLHTASRYGHAGVLRILISAFCNSCDVNKNGDSGLHIAAAMGRRKLTRILLEAGCDPNIRNKQGETAADIAKRKAFNEVVEILENPPPRVIALQETSPQSDKKVKKREKDSGTSQGSKDSGHKHKKDKHKKSKHGHKVHFEDVKRKETGKWSPYGCHLTPNLIAFPSPKLETLPPEPLNKGEQYFLDLAGNIRKGPVGKGYTCYCAPFFHNVEKKLEADKQELIDHIDNAHEDLNAKIAHLERKTRNQLFNLNQSVREKLAAEKTECLDRVERVALRERTDREAQHSSQREELEQFVREKVAQASYRVSPLGQSADSNSRSRFFESSHWSRRHRANKASLGVTKAKSEEVLHAQCYDDHELSPPPLFGNEVGLPPPPAHLAHRHRGGDFEKQGAKPKYPLWEQAPGDGTSYLCGRREQAAGQSPRTTLEDSPVRGPEQGHEESTASYKKEDFQNEEKETEDFIPVEATGMPPVANQVEQVQFGNTEDVTVRIPQPKPPLLPRPIHVPPYPSHIQRYLTQRSTLNGASSQARPLRTAYSTSHVDSHQAPYAIATRDGSDQESPRRSSGSANGAVEEQLCRLNEELTLDPDDRCPSSEV